jgi:alginate O-acetyltransferase complex protein AlgI
VAAALAIGKYGALGGLGAFATASPGVALGVSYVVIRLIDTLLRWHRGEHRDVWLADFLAYVLFPATLPAGPIQTIDQFRGGRLARISSADVAAGLSRLLLGAAKKIVVADYLLAQALFKPGGLFERSTMDPGTSSWPVLAATLLTSFLYAYADFSAYSDMAIGLGRLYGHRIPENFNWPVLASSLRDFWRRWHMTLSSWCMRNIYFPLVLGTRRIYQPLFAVMLAVGLWHAFAASWFAWALHHGAGLTILAVLERHRRSAKASARLRRAMGTAGTIAFVVAGHAFVLCGDFPTGLHIYARFLTLGLWP